VSLNIREATAADLPILQSIEQKIILAERPFDHTLKPDPISYYDLSELIESKTAIVIVAEHDGDIVGSGYAKKKRSRTYLQSEYHAYLGFMFVDPDHRGQGINKMIVDRLLDWARENDLPEVRLTAYPSNDPAIRAYEKSGFTHYITEMRLNLDE